MADGDSLAKSGTYTEIDNSAVDADVDDDFFVDKCGETGNNGKKKSKKKKKDKSLKSVAKSSEDSDCPVTHDSTVNSKTKDIKEDEKKEEGKEVKVESLNRALDLLKLSQNSTKNLGEAKLKNYAFWDTQPVPKLNEKIEGCGPIDPAKTVEEIRSEPYSLPTGFFWDTVDIDNDDILKEVYTLLNENYVEDDDNMFRFDYSPYFLRWALKPPGWKAEWHVGVRVEKSGKLVGFISAIPAHIRIYTNRQLMVEINFLCVHKKLRSKRVAPVLIREITRRVNKHNIFQAVYTAGVVLPKPVAICRYWHRSLNPRKLIDVKFSHLTRNMTMQRTLKLFKLPAIPKTQGFREMVEADVPKAFALLYNYLEKFSLAPNFNQDEFSHWFLPKQGIVNAYVVENAAGEITDMSSYYTLPSTIMHHPNHNTLKAAYSFYNVSTHTPLIDLIQDTLIAAKNLEFDVYNALDLMDNKGCLEALKFGAGDGNLQYYLYNWKCPDMPPYKVGLVLQ